MATTHGSGVVAVKSRTLLNHYTRDSQATSHTVVGRPTPEAQQWKQNTLLVSQLLTCKSVLPIIKIKSDGFLFVHTSDVPLPFLIRDILSSPP